jgi:hypothetical protein
MPNLNSHSAASMVSGRNCNGDTAKLETEILQLSTITSWGFEHMPNEYLPIELVRSSNTAAGKKIRTGKQPGKKKAKRESVSRAKRRRL